MKRIICLWLTLVLSLACFSACGNGRTKPSNVSMYDLSRAMLNAASFGDMTYVSSSDSNAEDLFAYLSDMEYAKVNQFFLAYATDGKGNADEIAVIELKDTADMSQGVSSLRAHLDKRINLYRTYDPQQSERIEKGTIFSASNYVALIVSDDNEAVKKAMLDSIGLP